MGKQTVTTIATTVDEVLLALILFEITFDEADVVIDFEHMEPIAI